MRYWLIKTEPGSWSWQDQLDAGEAGTCWDGVRNYQASNNLKAMETGDQCFFYHSVKEKSIVGIAEVIREYYPDPSDAKGRFGMVDVKAVKALPSPVTLADIKAEPRLAELALLRQSRLSVVPIDEESWALICRMGGV
ncbi:EVE domain-containing protein [Sneathiella chinensis]|uniref:Ubiquinol-cytochrome c reductase n=1 Tax=Sneathiella chinensis TaxID=349750 RepID=A0ABQ5U117_9PROT|nr:EVE domain-containing protein [Sneathiella chinensis]GLQ05037.1 ubiquinol-cytochrome c reductase [Sneathiella chinensis]